jgi:hypothetical protein
VVFESSNRKTISGIAGSIKAGFWSKVLKERGLESPGRDEAVAATLRHIEEKKLRAEAEYQEKKKKKK